MQHSKQIEDMPEIKVNVYTAMNLEDYFFFTAKSLATNYDCSQWKSMPLAEGWYYLIDTNKQFETDGVMINNKIFSCAVSFIVFTRMIDMYSEKGMEKEPIVDEFRHLCFNLMISIELVLNEEESALFHELIFGGDFNMR